MDELLDIPLRGLFRLLATVVRVLWFLIWDLAIEGVAWSVGWLLCRVFTLNRYPQQAVWHYRQASHSCQFFVSLLGFVTVAVTAILLLL